MLGRYRKTEVEQVAEAKLSGNSAKPLTPAQQVALQCKASDAKNKRRGK
jgi:hypothetical protein